MTVRVRFAPSNTGNLHMGGARTALFNHLFARQRDGTFILRIEDTDRERSKDKFTDAILEAMDWLGMSPDEGPFFQTERMDLYDDKVEQLLESGHAYRCYCSEEELEAQRQQARKEGRKPKYPGTCRDLDEYPEDEPHTVRIKMPADRDFIAIEDMVQGEVSVSVSELDDFIIRRTDGTPTYNFVVVVDDIDMEITHVVRGDDHLNNTFRQIPVYNALGADLPTFGHLPLIEGLSKREGSAAVQDYRDDGFLAEGIVNYISRLGWSHGDQEIFTRDELEEYFSFENVGRSSSKFDREKLRWVNSEWMGRLDAEELANRWVPLLQDRGWDAEVDDQLVAVVELMHDRADTLVELTDEASYFFTDDFEYDESAVDDWMDPANADAIEALIDRLGDLDEWTSDTVGDVYNAVGDDYDLGLANLAQPTRIALTGSTSSPSVFSLVATFEQAEVVRRFEKAIAELLD